MLAAYREGAPCPYCGASAEVVAEVLSARQRAADADIQARYESALLRADRAEAELRRLRARVNAFRRAFTEIELEGEA